MLYKMPRNVKNAQTSQASKLSKTPQNSQPSKVKITKATEEQIKKAPKISIDSDDDSEDEPHYLEEVINNFDNIDFESKYRELLFYHNSLKEENQGANEEITSLKFRLGQATADALKLNKTVSDLTNHNEDAEIRISHLERTIKNIKRKYNQEQDDNQQLIQERDEAREKAHDLFEISQGKDKEITDIQFKNETLQLTNDNLNTELKDLKIYADDCERNFSNLDNENTKILSESEDLKENAKADAETIKELEDTITGLQLEKEIICKQNEEISEKLKYFRQETLTQAGKRIHLVKEIQDINKENKDLKEKIQELENHNEKLTDSLDLEYRKSFYGGSEKTEHEEKIKRLEDLIKEKDESNTKIRDELKEMTKDRNINKMVYNGVVAEQKEILQEISTALNLKFYGTSLGKGHMDYVDDFKKVIKDLNDKNIKLQSGIVDFGTQILTLKNQISELTEDKTKTEKELEELKQRIKDGYEYDIHDIRQEHAHEKRAYKDEIENLKNKISEQDKLIDHFLNKIDGSTRRRDK